MTFNNNKYGVLSNWTRAWFLRRVETDGRKTLEYAGPIELQGSASSPSILKALVGMALLSHTDWFYASPTLFSSPPHAFGDSNTGESALKKAMKAAGNYNVSPVDGMYPRLGLDSRLCHFQSSTVRRSGIGSLVHAEFLREFGTPSLPVICKVVDTKRHDDNMLEPELKAYAALRRFASSSRTCHSYSVWIFQHLGHFGYSCSGICWRGCARG